MAVVEDGQSVPNNYDTEVTGTSEVAFHRHPACELFYTSIQLSINSHLLLRPLILLLYGDRGRCIDSFFEQALHCTSWRGGVKPTHKKRAGQRRDIVSHLLPKVLVRRKWCISLLARKASVKLTLTTENKNGIADS